MRKNRAKGEMVEVGGGRITRSLGRKDKHSKICTSKGARDRRIRLSANTAIQFYDVQDRLGYDRPSNAIDWLMKKAKAAIDVLNADHYHHLHELLIPDATTSILNLSEAFHRTSGDRNLQIMNPHEINGFHNYPFEIINSRNKFPLQEENPIPAPQNINFPSSTIPLHFAWNTNYNTGESYGFANREPLQSNFNPPVAYTLNNEFTNDNDDDEDGLLGFSFEQEIQVQKEEVQEKENDGNYGGRGVEGYMIV